MILTLKKGQTEHEIKTTFGGVYALEGEKVVVDHTKILPEERAKIKEKFDIIDPRGCKWVGGKDTTDNKAAIAEAKKAFKKADDNFRKATDDLKKAEEKAKKQGTPENIEAVENAKTVLEEATLAIQNAKNALDELEA